MDGNRKELTILLLILIALNDSGSLTIQLMILSVLDKISSHMMRSFQNLKI